MAPWTPIVSKYTSCAGVNFRLEEKALGDDDDYDDDDDHDDDHDGDEDDDEDEDVFLLGSQS